MEMGEASKLREDSLAPASLAGDEAPSVVDDKLDAPIQSDGFGGVGMQDILTGGLFEGGSLFDDPMPGGSNSVRAPPSERTGFENDDFPGLGNRRSRIQFSHLVGLARYSTRQAWDHRRGCLPRRALLSRYLAYRLPQTHQIGSERPTCHQPLKEPHHQPSWEEAYCPPSTCLPRPSPSRPLRESQSCLRRLSSSPVLPSPTRLHPRPSSHRTRRHQC